MTARLGTRIGLPADAARSHGPDVVLFHEPKVGSVMRTKGTLFVLAQVTGAHPSLTRAAREALEGIRDEYYYDLSAGVLGALSKAVRTVNRRLYQGRERLGLTERAGIGVICVVLQAREAHVVKLGPASAAIVRGERMYELPPPPPAEEEDPRVRQRRVAATLGEALEIQPFTWRGEVAAGDRVLLVSRNLASVVGSDELRETVVALRPAAAVERLQETFGARGGSGSDGLVVVELVELPATTASRPLEPVYPNDALAGLPDANPVPLADAMGRVLTDAQETVHGLRARLVSGILRVFALLLAFVPRRRAAYPRRVSRTAVREAGRRRRAGLVGMAAVALLIAAGLTARNVAGPSPTEAIPRTAIARESIAAANELLATVERTVEGASLIDRAPDEAADLLTSASREIDRAREAGVTPEALASLRARVDGGLDRLYQVGRLTAVDSLVELGVVAEGAVGTRMVGASDGSLWVIDALGGRVLRVDPADGSGSVILQAGQATDGGTPGAPWLITSAATDVVVIDQRRQAWRIDLTERIPRRMTLNGEAAFDPATRLLGSVQHRPPLEIFTLYAVDPASGTILKWTPPAVIPVDYPDPPVSFLTAPPDLSPADARDILVDVNLWLLHATTVTRVNFATPLTQSEYSLDPPPDAELRPRLDYRLFDAVAAGDRETFYVYDAANLRILAFNRPDGAFVRQWLAGTSPDDADTLTDIRGMVVNAVGDGPPVAYLLSADRIVRTILE